jgi:hypothetical protein
MSVTDRLAPSLFDMRASASVAAALAALLLGACGGQEQPAAEPATEEAPTTQVPTIEVPAATTQAAPAPATTEVATTEAATTEAATIEAETTATPETPPLEPGLPEIIEGYQGWPKLNAAPIPPNPDGDAHLGEKEVFASEPAGPDGVYPDRAIIVKEAVRPDADFLGLVAIMRKEQGADPAHNDWVFDEYTRSSADAPFELTAADDVCWSCHMGAAQTDYVWIETLGLAR